MFMKKKISKKPNNMLKLKTKKNNTVKSKAKVTQFIVANWKMNPPHKEAAMAIWSGIKKAALEASASGVKTVICPPAVYAGLLAPKVLGSEGVAALGLQDVFYENEGSYTGAVSISMLQSIGATYVIVGHSERRIKLGETDAQIAQKVNLALATGITPILCVGEHTRDTHGQYLDVIRDQLKASLAGIDPKSIRKIIIAYEPVWAIGKTDKDAMKPSDIHETKIFIHKTLTDIYGSDAAKVPVLYGGSVSSVNAPAILENGEVDGLLVGGKSLIPEEFSAIINAAAGVALK